MAAKHFLIPARLAAKLPSLQKLGWMIEALIVKSLSGLLRSMSPERAARFANFMFRNLKPVLPFTRKIRGNLTVAFPNKDAHEIEQLTRKTCGNLGNVAAELVLAGRIWAEREQRIEFVLEDGLDIAPYRDHPAVMVSGHIGAWQIGAFIAAHFELPFTTVYAPEENPYLRDFIFKLRSALPCSFLPRDGSMRALMKELQQGRTIGLVSDTRLDSGDPLPFFGVPTPTNTAAARLAVHRNCDLLPVSVERLPGMRFRITLYKPVRPVDPHAPATEQARQMTSCVIEKFEAWIREDPSQWMCFGRRWPHEAYANASPASKRPGN